MKKLLQVREFDTITGNPNYKGDNRFVYYGSDNEQGKVSKEFTGLVEFIREYTADENNADALEFMKVGYKRGPGEIVTIQNYVGLIQLSNGNQIQVLPKIDFDTADVGDEKTKRVFLKMLRSMKDFPGKVFNDANLKIDRMNLYEIFINMYIQEVRNLVKHGIKSDYITVEDNLYCFKGKLLVNKDIKHNAAHKERVYVQYDEYQPNRPENKLIKSTLLKLQKITSSTENSKAIKQLLTAFEMVDPSTGYEADFSKVKLDRNMSDYKNLMTWSRVFLFNKGFSTFSGSTKSRALLFPMEKVFESYVAKYVKKVFAPRGWNVSVQDKGYYLFEQPAKKFSLRPDIVLEKNGRIIVMDTKWKKLKDDPRINYNISQADMYQMYAYSKKYGAEDIWLLYPESAEMNNKSIPTFDSGDNTNVHVSFVDLEDIENYLDNIENSI